MTITRTLAALLIALASIALAEAHFSAADLRNVIANEIDALVTECPEWVYPDPEADTSAVGDPECFIVPSSIDIARLQLERAVRQFRDLSWLTAWRQYENGSLMRVVVSDEGEIWAIFAPAGVPDDRWSQLIVFQEFTAE